MENDSTIPKLVFSGEHFVGRIYELSQEKTTVGRGDHNILILRRRSVSQAHCEILVHGPEVIVRDLGSANGTFVDGVRVSPQSQVKSGKILRFGLVQARLDLGFPSENDGASDLTAVYTLRRIVRDQKKDEKSPTSTSAGATFESGAYGNSNATDQTVRMLAPFPIEPNVTREGPSKSEISNPKVLRKNAVLIGVLAFDFAFFLWLIWGRR